MQDQSLVDIIKKTISDALFNSFNLKSQNIEVEHPSDLSHGDYSTNIALKVSKDIKKSPLEIAEKLKQTIIKNEVFEKLEVVKPGFINFFLSKSYLLSQISKVLNEKDKYGFQKNKTNKKLMVEYAHPNTHKVFHIGHLRNISIGESVARLLEAMGNDVIRVNYQGDIGLHIAKCLWALQKIIQEENRDFQELEGLDIQKKIDLLGKMYVKGSLQYKESEKNKAEINEINQKIYNGDKEVNDLWTKTRKWSLDYFDIIYKMVGTTYDRLYFESGVQESGLNIAKKALKENILELSNGATIFNGEDFNLDTRVFINSLGLPTYEAKDLGLAYLQFSEFGDIDKCIHVVGAEQKAYFKVLFKVQELIDRDRFENKQQHLDYAHVVLKEGKMSSREGKVIAGKWLLEEGIKQSSKLIKDNEVFSSDEKKTLSQKVGIGAVKYSMLKFPPQTKIKFDFNEAVSLEGNSGPYLQYTYARTKSLLAKIGEPFSKSSFYSDSSFELSDKEESLLRTIYKFPEIVFEAANNYLPNLICSFLFDLSQRYNSFYNDYPILKAELSIRDFRLSLTEVVGQIIKNGLYLLGIEVSEKM